MMIIRYIEPKDVNDLYLLAQKAGFGLTSLQPNMEKLAARIERACKTVAGELPKADQVYLFVLEDTDLNKVVGVCGIEVALGLKEPWYNFHVGTQVHASEPLSVYNALPTLYLSNDHTNCSELCTLFLDPDYRLNKNGKFYLKYDSCSCLHFVNISKKPLLPKCVVIPMQMGNHHFGMR